MATPQEIHDGIADISRFILPYAITLAALGALTVGLLEAWKKVFATLPRFHRRSVGRWLVNESPPPSGGLQLRSTLASGHYGLTDHRKTDEYDPRRAYAQLIHLTTGAPLNADGIDVDTKGNSLARNINFALFELDIAKMMSQVQEAADAALNNPERYPDWFAFITRGCNASDVSDWRAVLSGGADPAVRDKGAAAYGRIRLLIRRQLDGFQTVTAYRWREWNQWWAWLVGALLMMLAQLLQTAHGNWWEMVFFSLFGGILAPVAKDLVDALSNIKRGP